MVLKKQTNKQTKKHGIGADISLSPCLATGIWNLAPKAISGTKCREASFAVLTFILRTRSFPINEILTVLVEKNICIGSTKSNLDAVKKNETYGCEFLQQEAKTFN